MAGRGYLHISTFSENDSNTIDDISGFKKKFSEVSRRWDGVYGAPDMIEARQPQDFPVTAQKQVVFKNVRSEQVEAEGAVSPGVAGGFDDGFDAGFDVGAADDSGIPII